MSTLRNYVLKQVAEGSLVLDEAEAFLKEMKSVPKSEDDSIAIIGMSGRFPKSPNLDAFWNNLVEGNNCIGEFPEQRKKDINNIFDNPHYFEFLIGGEPPKLKEGEDAHGKGGYLDEIDKFDAGFFGIPPREVLYMDPLQRLFLETAWESIEDAGYGGTKIVGTRTGVFVGKDNTSTALYKYITEADPMHLTGTWEGILASRIAYIFNLKGPSMVLDTACSSGLVSIHMACQSLKNKECEMAIAGGIAHTYGYFKNVKGPMDLSSVESENSTVRTFDKDANGTVWGEGVGAVLLKPLKKALEDGDNIHAVIRGSAINNDGASNGITAPSVTAQEDVISRAWKKANINPESIQYVEAHGTGTVLGDPIEVKGLTNVFRKYTDKKQFCGIGSLKTNMGHMVAASGVASLLKVVLAMKNSKLPASINFENPNPYINFADSPLYVNDQLQDWHRGEEPRRAGVSSFGFSGTNCHVIVEEAPERSVMQQLSADEPIHVLALSAKSEPLLNQLINRYHNHFSRESNTPLEDICYTANTGRGHYSHRIVMIFHDRQDLLALLEKLQDGDYQWLQGNGIFYGEHKIVPETKKDRLSGEITEGDKLKYSRMASERIQKTATERLSEQILIEVSNLYVRGADLDWKALYEGQERMRVSLPTYPFERVRYWATPKCSKISQVQTVQEHIHPLVQRCLVESMDHQIYETEFSAQDHWVLSDHKIMGHYVLPGTTYIEIARVVGNKYFHSNQLEIRDVLYMSPLLVKENEKKVVQTIVTKEKDYIKFVTASKEEGLQPNDGWVVHAEGKVALLRGGKAIDKDLEGLLKQVGAKPDSLTFEKSGQVFTFGPRWDNVTDVHFIGEDALVELDLLDPLKNDVDVFQIHPGLLDNAVNTTSQSIGEGTYLPLTYKSFKVYSSVPSRLYSLIHRQEGNNDNQEIITFDVTLMDRTGKVVAEILSYSIKKVHQVEQRFNQLSAEQSTFYQMQWKEAALSEPVQPAKETLVLLTHVQDAFSQEVAEEITKQGNQVILVESGSSYKKINDNFYITGWAENDIDSLMTDLQYRGVSKIVQMVNNRNGSDYISDASSFDIRQQQGIMWLFHTVKSCLKQKWSGDVQLVLVSDYINEVDGSERLLRPYDKPLFGLGKVVVQEYGNIKCRCLDIDDSVTANMFVNELNADSFTYEIAYRNGKRFAEEMTGIMLPLQPTEDLQLKREGCYIITGGTGGLGLEVANYLADTSNVNLALLSRTLFPERDQWDVELQQGTDKKLQRILTMITEIEKKGSTVTLVQTDISDTSSLSSALAHLRLQFGSINGLIHCAGVAGDGFIMRKSEEVFKGVLHPKVRGTWNLDQLTREDALEFFIMFSSIASLTGGAGQGDYTAANAFMDAYADYMNKQGRKAKSINWPAWKEIGMAADYQVTDEYVNFKAISPLEAIQALGRVLHSSVTRVIPGRINFSFLAKTESILPFSLSDSLRTQLEAYKMSNASESIKDSTNQQTADVRLSGKSSEEYSETEQILGTLFGQVLGLSEVDVYESFHAMGGDSILATYLLKAIESVIPDVLDISDIFTYPSVIQMSEYVDRKTGATQGNNQVAAAKSDSNDSQLASLLDDMEQGTLSVEDALKSILK